MPEGATFDKGGSTIIIENENIFIKRIEAVIMSPKTQKNTKTIIVGEGRGFDRIRRITGYLVGTTDRWNDAKRAEEHDRVKHSL